MTKDGGICHKDQRTRSPRQLYEFCLLELLGHLYEEVIEHDFGGTILSRPFSAVNKARSFQQLTIV